MEDPKSEATQIELSGPAESSPFDNMTEDERNRMERKMIRKVDFRLLTMTILMYILNYLDRNNIASAKLAGMQTDLKLHGNQYEVIHPKHTRRR
jgi:sugar phosphate permease